MHAYRERVCLIQISIPSDDFIIDPLAPLDLSGLGDLIAEPGVEKVFHAAEYDLTLLKRQFNWNLNNLFDTMWAARILGYSHYGLASLLKDLYQVQLNKRYQKSDWCRRPLSLAQRIYAQLDTHYLLRLRDHFAAELQQAGRLEEALETFAAQTRVKPNNAEFDPDSFWSINGVQDLSPRQRAVLKALSCYRDQEARSRDKPHFKVFSNRTMLELAQMSPTNVEQLRQVHGMTSGQTRRLGKKILTTIQAGKQAPLPTRPKRQRRPPDQVLSRYDRLHRWRKERAKARGVESDVILSRDALWELATANPCTAADLADIALLGDWRAETYGKEILAILQRVQDGRKKP
jgi:ribonuclease D